MCVITQYTNATAVCFKGMPQLFALYNHNNSCIIQNYLVVARCIVLFITPRSCKEQNEQETLSSCTCVTYVVNCNGCILNLIKNVQLQ